MWKTPKSGTVQQCLYVYVLWSNYRRAVLLILAITNNNADTILNRLYFRYIALHILVTTRLQLTRAGVS